ncbi:MAG: DUF3850 domain-containing protein [Candidatus Pacearchaeota archaeon]
MAKIKKKTSPDLFQRVLEGKKNVDLRLADFDLAEGDTLILEEYDPEKGYTGRALEKKVKNLNKVNLTDFHSCEEISEKGHGVIEFD